MSSGNVVAQATFSSWTASPAHHKGWQLCNCRLCYVKSAWHACCRTADRQHVVACINVEDFPQLSESHGAVVLPLEVCGGVWRRHRAALPGEKLLDLHRQCGKGQGRGIARQGEDMQSSPLEHARRAVCSYTARRAAKSSKGLRFAAICCYMKIRAFTLK